MRRIVIGLVGALVAFAAAAAHAAPTPAEIAQEVGAPAEPVLHGPPATAVAIVEVERAFAARSAAAGPAIAFGEYMDAADSRAFQGGDPLRGAAAIAASHGPGERLVWAPSEVFASTGDMAVDWGRWLFTSGSVKVTGRFVTVWRKNADGKWKAIIDLGTPDPAAKP